MDMVQQRDARGHYTGTLEPDAELAAKWAEEDRRADLAVEALAKLGIPPDMAGLTKRPGREGWMMEARTRELLMGALFGLLLGKKSTDKQIADMLWTICDALNINLGPMIEKRIAKKAA